MRTWGQRTRSCKQEGGGSASGRGTPLKAALRPQNGPAAGPQRPPTPGGCGVTVPGRCGVGQTRKRACNARAAPNVDARPCVSSFSVSAFDVGSLRPPHFRPPPRHRAETARQLHRHAAIESWQTQPAPAVLLRCFCSASAELLPGTGVRVVSYCVLFSSVRCSFLAACWLHQ